MLRKKLLALGCAVAIVGVGACFLPPEHVAPPPLPPYLGHIRTFSVEVQDASGQDVIDGGAMSREVVSNFNQLWKEFILRARQSRTSSPNDPILRIKIVRKSASIFHVTDRRQEWAFDLKASSTLTACDGRLLWQNPEQNTKFRMAFDKGLPSDGWNSREVRHEAAYWLAMDLGDSFYGLDLGTHQRSAP
ncbi:hypothetical protein [Occallatibacter savannae]|uniref:hypothetical protein n=1 Tax=Occallatibacter savannae TaxID=1002691 RepID=UPI000D698965|nr:hypothetical protein [Occallatibacter savannae]